MDKELRSGQSLTKLVNEKGIRHWDDLLHFVRHIPYGRNSVRNDFSLVITENKGTCSSKHAFLKVIALENEIPEVKLILCLYKMSEHNTPGIGNELTKNGIPFLPEAHCYLACGEEKLDVTNSRSDLNRIADDIIAETEISPEQVGTYKVDYHQAYLREWLGNQDFDLDFRELWSIRERCIANLSVGNTNS